MAQFDAILRSTVGGTACQLMGYAKSAEGLFDGAGERIGTHLRFECQGEISAAGAEALAAALAAFAASASTDGVDFQIFAHNLFDPKEEVLAADCTEGPRVSYQYVDPNAATVQGVRFTVEAVRAVDPDEDGVLSETTTAQVDISAEGLSVLALSGRVVTAAGTSAIDRFLAENLPEEQAGFQQTYRYGRNETDTECTWEVRDTELVAAYPVLGESRVVDGEKTVETAFDEHNRKITRYQYTYTGPYAKTYLEAEHTTLRATGTLMRASISWTVHKTESASGTFEVLADRGGAGEVTDLLELTETISHARSAALLREVRYPGTASLVAQDDQPGYVYEQAGRAVGRKKYPQPPAHAFDAANLAEAPEIVLARTNDQEFETSWRFRFLFAAEQSIQFPHARSACPGFYS